MMLRRDVCCNVSTGGRSTGASVLRPRNNASARQLQRWINQPPPAKMMQQKQQKQLQQLNRGPSPQEQLVDKSGQDEMAPTIAAIEARPHNMLIQALFRKKMAKAVDADVHSQGYDAIIDLTRRLNQNSPQETQARTVEILKSLFPSWLLPAFKVLFSKPLPEFACKLNAWATALTCEWLMGPCKVNDVEVDGDKLGVGQGVAVQRCRYLEQAGCTSICVNSCKVPTQTFFAQEMGLALTMTPNYEDFSCQFAFGKTPPPQSEDPAFAAPCFSQCPSKQRDRGDAFAQLQRMAAAAGVDHESAPVSAGADAVATAWAAVGARSANKCHKVKVSS